MSRLLVVTGDYDVLQRVRGVLQTGDITVQPGYSHLDAMYLLSSHPFDGVFIDASVSDKRTGEPTYMAIAKVAPQIACVVYIPQTTNLMSPPAEPGSNRVIVTTLDDRAMARTAQALLGTDHPQAGEYSRSPLTHRPSTSAWTAEEVQAFVTLSRSLTEVLDLTEVLNRVVAAARDLTDAEEGMILLPDGESDQLYLRAKVGIDSETARNFRVKTQDTVAGAVFKSGSPSLVGQSGPQKVKTEYFVKSLLYVPILLKGKPIGVLGVNNKQREDTFDQRHQELLLNLAAYAAIAIENARVHGQSVKRARELKALVDASERLNQSLMLEHTLQAMVDQLVQVLNVNDALVLDLDRENGLLRVLARGRRVLWRGGQERILNLDEYPQVLSALRSGGPKLITRMVGGREAEWLETVGAETLTLLPIYGDEQLLGALFAFNRSRRAEMSLPGPEAALRSRQLTIEVVMELAKGRDRVPAQIYRLADETNAVINSDWSEVGLLSDQHTVAIQTSVGAGMWLEGSAPFFPLLDYPDVLQALEQQAMINVHRGDLVSSNGQQALLEFTGNNMILGLPMVQRGQTAGMIVFGDSEHDHLFSPREVDLAKAVAGQASSALQNARLYSELQYSLQELKATQTRLIQAERLSAMGELAAAVAHQINNPLTTILSDGQLLLERSPAGSLEAESLAAIVRSGKRAKGVVRRLLAAVRTTEPTGFEAIDVIASIEETVTLVRPHLIREGIQLYERLPEQPLPPVRAIPGELDDIWLNLLLNAHDALAGREYAELGVDAGYRADDRLIEVTIWDNGPGIPADMLTHIFKPFFTTKPIGEGTGLGLHIAKQVVDRIGGSILVESTPDVGTKFTVLLPVLK